MPSAWIIANFELKMEGPLFERHDSLVVDCTKMTILQDTHKGFVVGADKKFVAS